MVDFGNRLRALRIAKGWTQSQLSSRLGLTKSVISAIAAGRDAASAIDQVLGGDGDIEEKLVDVPSPPIPTSAGLTITPSCPGSTPTSRPATSAAAPLSRWTTTSPRSRPRRRPPAA